VPSHGGIGRFNGNVTSVDSAGRAVTALPIPDRTFSGMKGTKVVGKPTRVGNEGAGRVIAAGKGSAAQKLKGKIVAAVGFGGSYSQHAVLKVSQCLEHEEGSVVTRSTHALLSFSLTRAQCV
jgi:NADPH:quinone reductase-like Zn-dependent oxidoreductase